MKVSVTVVLNVEAGSELEASNWVQELIDVGLDERPIINSHVQDTYVVETCQHE